MSLAGVSAPRVHVRAPGKINIAFGVGDVQSDGYHDVASALGGAGFAAHDAAGLASALRQAAASGLPACINVSLAGEAAPVFHAASMQSTTGH